MLIPMRDAADYIEISLDTLYTSGKYKPFVVKSADHYLFDMKAYSAYAAELQKEENFCIDAVNFAEFVMEIVGEDDFWKQIPTMKRKEVKRGFKKNRFAPSVARAIEDIFGEAWRESYDNYEEVDEKPEYVPFEEREPLTRWYLMGRYWQQRKTTEEIAKELNVPEGWVQGEIRRLGMQKKANAIKLKGRTGYVMPEKERAKHRVQPHAKPVVQICPKRFEIIKEYTSTGAVERHGFKRENVRKAIRRAGLHKGYLWAHKGWERSTVENAKKRGNLDTKLQAASYKRPTKKQLKGLYIDQNMTAGECAKVFRCSKGTIATLAMNYGLKKRTGKISIETLKRLYISKGMSAKEIAEEYGYSVKSITTYLSRNGIKRILA